MPGLVWSWRWRLRPLAGKRFRKVAVLMGGPSLERDVSLRSGRAVVRGLRAAGYAVSAVRVSGRRLPIARGTEAVFVALHGEFGEDGEVQAVLRRKGLPYTGSGIGASKRAFDKVTSKRVFVRRGVRTPRFEVLGAGGRRTLRLPVVTKPLRQGSTIGVHLVRREAEWRAAFDETISYDGRVLVERYIAGRELTVGVVGEDALPVVEIRAPGDWYDFRAKYTEGRTEYLVPAPLNGQVMRRCRAAGLAAFKALGCRGFGRVDLRLSVSGRAYVLEVNTVPGFTETSLLPKAAKAAGLEFPALCDRIMQSAAL